MKEYKPPVSYKVDEVATLLRISRSTADDLIHTGKLRARRAGRRILIPASALDEYLAGSDLGPQARKPMWARRSA